MALELLSYTSKEILELFKSAFYDQYGTPMITGSDDFTSASVMAYVLTVLVNALNVASNQRFLDTATGEFLDAIASVNGLSRPAAASASAVFSLVPVTAPATIPAGALRVSDGNAIFINDKAIYLASNPTQALLYCTEAGAQNNGISAGSIDMIAAGGSYVDEAENIDMTSGGDDGYPYTPEGDVKFREYIKNMRSAYAAGGPAPAYRARALQCDNRILDVYIAKDGDSVFEKGKVKIYALFDFDATSSALRAQIKDLVLSSCKADDFRCVGDFIQVFTATQHILTLNNNFLVKYPMKFKGVAVAHLNAVFDAYRKYLFSGYGRPFSESELAKRLITPDADGVYALAFDVKNTDARWNMPSKDSVYIFDYPYISTNPKPSIDTYISAGYIQLIDTGE